jgi:hypothetical protein
MRLLRIEDGGGFGLVELVGSNIPPYAILSHTWGADEEEVTFKDLVDGTGKTKNGYRKLYFCAKQAVKDTLQHFWVDTCCIDKSSSAELSEAINSMYRWYHHASRCYVYLSDVSIGGSTFRSSRWFTRGWTLQELVAPTSVEFFSSEGERIGDKNSLVRDIAEITGISVQALQGQRPLYQFGVDERMLWAKGRQTKREEDAAYSLLGIFDIHMPLLYGEGRNKALVRLQKEIEQSLEDRQTIPSLISETETAEPTEELYKYRIPFNNLGALVHEHQVADAQQRILDSLRFPQIQERRHQIHEAYKETCQWILQPAPNQIQQWDSLVAWLSSSTESRRIYWIYGKPGSGKSTMMQFLDQNIVIPGHMLPWAESRTVLSAQYFFWSPGHKLQKSVTGLLRALLMQLLEKQPHLIPQVVHQSKWAAARTPGNQPIDWTTSDLQHALHEYILSVQSYAKVFLLLDGLDELEDSDDAREELISLLINTARLENVKVCLSSRPWNIFRDAFEEFPQLRLEDLTYGDINKYVKAQLHSHIRFQYLLRYDRMNAQSLVSEIIHKAAGVFLWVRLVVRELLKGIRDGDGTSVLRKKLEEIPGDLNVYFRRLMDSISPCHRQEASELLQIALHKENEFTTLHPLRLIDLSFIDEGCPDFALTRRYNHKDLNLTDCEKLQFRLDSTMRLLNSRCMGLLECQYHPDQQIDEDGYDLVIPQPAEEVQENAQDTEIREGQNFEPSIYPQIFRAPNSLRAFSLTVDFLHRSCRDFLLTPEIQCLLHQYTHGSYDSRMFLLNSRLSQFVAFGTARMGERHALAIASYILSVLSLPTYKFTPVCAVAAAFIQPVLEKIVQNHRFPRSYWYIDPTIVSWHDEQSSFLTLAIDFELSAYVKTYLTPEYIQKKSGRPILDYILRPRFAMCEEISIGNCEPNLDLLRVVLRFRADPNGMYGSVTVWALFLCFLADMFDERTDDTYFEYTVVLELLIRAGAAPLLPKSWLSYETKYKRYHYTNSGLHMSPDKLFSYRWPAVVPVMGSNPHLGYEPWYAVSDLLGEFRSHLGSGVDDLRRLLDARTSKILWQPSN